MLVVSLLSHAEFEPSDHREDAPHFTWKFSGWKFSGWNHSDVQNLGQKFGQYNIFKINTSDF